MVCERRQDSPCATARDEFKNLSNISAYPPVKPDWAETATHHNVIEASLRVPRHFETNWPTNQQRRAQRINATRVSPGPWRAGA